jgi:hypothetical protein
MADPLRGPNQPERQPPGVEGEGLDPYPTYRDGPSSPHAATTGKPTDTGLPISRRTRPGPIVIALLIFALLVIFYLVWGSLKMSSGGEVVPSLPDTPATSLESSEEQPGSPDENMQMETETGPGEVTGEPGPVDVPGGATTSPPPGGGTNN